MRTLKFVLLMAISSLAAWSCKPLDGASLQENATQEPISALQALVVEQPGLAASPPIARDFIIQQLERPDLNGNNLLFKAIFNPKEPRLLNVTSFSVNVSEGMQVLLRDDGRNGDDIANDRIFSAFVKDDIARLTAFLKAKNVELERNRLMVTRLSGREMIPSKTSMIDMVAFAAKKPISLGGGTTASLVSPADFNLLKDHSLVITDLGVVQDPVRTFDPCSAVGDSNGVWTFKSLMTKMANTASTGVPVDSFVMKWVDTELFGAKTQTTSGDITTPPIRDDMSSATSSKRVFIAAWLKNAGLPNTATSHFTNWKTLLSGKLSLFPVRLLAIVNRLDLRGNFGYTGGTSNGGEGRFVFCFVNSNDNCNATATFKKMTIILEYGIPISSCNGLKNYAQQWYDLKNHNLNGSSNNTYNTALQAVTDVFTNQGAGGSKPNGSALNHLRTNEFLTTPWNIRDFAIQSTSKQLALIHPHKEPMSESNVNSTSIIAAKIADLAAFVNNSTNQSLIETEGNYNIPDGIKAIDAQIPSPSATPAYFWNGPAITSDLARHKLSMGTCSGCHARETKTNFTHILPANFGAPAPLSAFITGLGSDDSTDVDTDPMGSFFIKDVANRPTAATAPKRGFNELLRRANDLETLKSSSCGMLSTSLGTTVSLANILQFQVLSAD